MCNDKISRQALLDEINEEIEYGEEHFRPENEQINKGLKIARKLVRALPAIETEPVDDWISVDDRLPPYGERVFVYIPRPENHYHIEIAYISKGNDDYPYWVLSDESRFYSTRFYYISHWMPIWMPLPEPKGE